MSLFSPQIKVAVLRGGPSQEYEVSLKTGANVLAQLRKMPEVYYPIDIFISKDGEWHREGIVYEPHDALKHVDVVFNAMHGAYGEDGEVQRLLESMNTPFTGSGSFASALSMHKGLTKNVYNQHNLLTPQHELIKETIDHNQLIKIFRNYLHPVIIKPASGGSSMGLRLAHTFKELEEEIHKALEQTKQVIVEEYIKGKEATCGVVEKARGEDLYALLPIEIRKGSNKLFDYESKYSGKAEEICPGNFSSTERDEITHMSKKAHEALGLKHYSRSDFMITPSGKIYILETNSLPGLTEESLLPKSLAAVGWNHEDFIDHCIQLALGKI